MVTEIELIARQAIEIAELREENNRLERNIMAVMNIMCCIGGPLNDNKLQYSTEQLETFF